MLELWQDQAKCIHYFYYNYYYYIIISLSLFLISHHSTTLIGDVYPTNRMTIFDLARSIPNPVALALSIGYP